MKKLIFENNAFRPPVYNPVIEVIRNSDRPLKGIKRGKHAIDCVLSKGVGPLGTRSNFDPEDLLAIIEFMDMVEI